MKASLLKASLLEAMDNAIVGGGRYGWYWLCYQAVILEAVFAPPRGMDKVVVMVVQTVEVIVVLTAEVTEVRTVVVTVVVEVVKRAEEDFKVGLTCG